MGLNKWAYNPQSPASNTSTVSRRHTLKHFPVVQVPATYHAAIKERAFSGDAES